MSNFTEVLKADAAGAFCDPEAFGETVAYKPKGAASRTFAALVFRQAPEPVAGTVRPAPSLEVLIPNSTDATKGVASIDKEGDRVSVADRQGGTATDHLIAEIIAQDAGAWHLRLR